MWYQHLHSWPEILQRILRTSSSNTHWKLPMPRSRYVSLWYQHLHSWPEILQRILRTSSSNTHWKLPMPRSRYVGFLNCSPHFRVASNLGMKAMFYIQNKTLQMGTWILILTMYCTLLFLWTRLIILVTYYNHVRMHALWLELFMLHLVRLNWIIMKKEMDKNLI